MIKKFKPGTLLLKYIAVTNLAIAQPLYEVLQQSPELFTTHRTSGFELILFTLILSLGFALLPVITVATMARVSRPAAVIFDFLLLGSFLSLLMLYLLKQTSLDNFWLLPMSVSLGAVTWLALYRIHILQLWVQFLAIAGLVLPVMFLMQENIRPLIEITRLQHGFAGDLKSTPIVFVIFDQLPTAALIDANGNVDRERYPNFAALTDVAHWFRNHTATAQDTVTSVPAILTGTYTRGKKAPNITIFPNNIFTFLSDRYEQNLSQHATDMGTDRTGESQFSVLLKDVFLIYLHILLPNPFLAQLPSLQDRPANFWVSRDLGSVDITETSTTRFQAFIANINDRDNQLHYLHIDVPHGPYRFHASGARYTWKSSVPGLTAAWGRWGEDETPIRKAQQRFMAQVQLADLYLGEIVEKMRQQGIFERALIVVTSDHGVSFRPKGHTRAVLNDNYRDILYVPLMIKLPNQRSGEISTRNVETIDIFPTIIHQLGGDVLWPIDGVSVFAENREKGVKQAFTSIAGVDALREYESRGGGEFHKLEPMSDKFIWDADRRWNRLPHPRDDLLGKPVNSVLGEFYPLATGEKGFLSDKDLDQEESVFEINAGWVRGEAIVPGTLKGKAELAIAVSGKVVAMTSTFAHLDARHYFAELLPEGVSSAGNVQVFVLRP